MIKHCMATPAKQSRGPSFSATLTALCAVSALVFWTAPAQAAACTPAGARLPPNYARLPGANKLPAQEREHRLELSGGTARDAKKVEVQIEERALGADGRCDLIISVRELISSGGDSDVLSTVYLTRPDGGWQRVGAVSARRDDRPSSLDLMRQPADERFAFSDWQVLTLKEHPGLSYLMTWNHDRVANGARGYHLLELDRSAATLRSLDIWQDVGAKVYAQFKQLKSEDGRGFDPYVEQAELRLRCAGIAAKPALLVQACSALAIK